MLNSSLSDVQQFLFMHYISESSIVQKITKQILEPRRSSYNQQPISSLMTFMEDYEHVDSSVYNKYNEKLKVSLFFNRNYQHQKCIVYVHGYGSNRIQGIMLLRFLPPDLSLCCFDFSAQGKSQGSIVTFGQKEKDDIRAILGYLRSCGYSKFILWGRSMGATCTLWFTVKQKPVDIILQILDSPFISFEQAALGLTRKKIKIPQSLLKIIFQVISTNLSKKQYNPFEVDLNQPIVCSIPTVFLYSEDDQVISSENSVKLTNNFTGHYEKLVINQPHNAIRSSETIRDIIGIIKKYIIRSQQNLKLSLAPNQMSLSISPTKKRQYLNKKNNNNNMIESYGIWVSSKKIDKLQSQQRLQREAEKTRLASSDAKYNRLQRKKQLSRTKIELSHNIMDIAITKQFQVQTPKIHRLSHSKLKSDHKKNRLNHHFYL